MSSLRLADYVADIARSALAEHAALPPWELTARAPTIVTQMLAAPSSGFERAGDVVWHGSTRIEEGAIVKGPAVIGPWLPPTRHLGRVPAGHPLRQTGALDGSRWRRSSGHAPGAGSVRCVIMEGPAGW